MADERKQREYVYRCRMCGALKGGPAGGITIMDVIKVVNEIETEGKPGVYVPHAVVSRWDLHYCDERTVGISDLVGVRDLVDSPPATDHEAHPEAKTLQGTSQDGRGQLG